MTEYPSTSDTSSGAERRDAQDSAPSSVDERNRRLARAGVARAEEVLVTRYRIPSRQEAFELLRRTSQKYNVRLHTLADVAVRLPAPEAGAPRWVPNRPQGAAPAIPALRTDPSQLTSPSAVLKAALRHTLRVTDAPMGNVQLAECGMLRLEQHIGLNRHFTDYFAFVDDSTTACAQAAEERRQVTVKDVASSDIFDEASRQTILRAGSRACHSVPLVSPKGRVMGMISTHHERPVGGFSPARLTALHHLGGQVGRWILWHRNTTVFTALNDLHGSATRRN
ncbi:GAF and ANTAR domain-containing protein [Streptomyces sp. NPDC005921]|uniref:GAF and ANTAR domain-containing protein n=1 Tax=Streptomyces sp. NPDC005827 TaxID=3157070 RepID=UPI0033DFF985